LPSLLAGYSCWVWGPNYPAKATDILLICATMATYDFAATRYFEMTPGVLIGQKVADSRKFIPVFVD